MYIECRGVSALFSGECRVFYGLSRVSWSVHLVFCCVHSVALAAVSALFSAVSRVSRCVRVVFCCV